MKKDNSIQEKSMAFAVRIVNLYKYLVEEKQEQTLSKQLLRSGTSIGANVRESINAQSSMDFISKLNVALKEADETRYWLELLHKTDFLNEAQFNSIYQDSGELVALLISIIKTTKNNILKQEKTTK